MSSANVQDVEHWLNCRICEMRNALEYGDARTGARCGSLVAQGVAIRCSDECPVQFDVGTDQRGRHQEEVCRRRFARCSVTRNSRYGLRGCRIGEASNPGPPRTRVRPEGVSEPVVLWRRPSQLLTRQMRSLWCEQRQDGRGFAGSASPNRVQVRVPTDSRQQQTHHQTLRFLPAGQIPVLWGRLEVVESESRSVVEVSAIPTSNGSMTRVSRPQCQPRHAPLGWIGMMLMNPVLCLRILVRARWI